MVPSGRLPKPRWLQAGRKLQTCRSCSTGSLQTFTGAAQVLHNLGLRLPPSPRQHPPHPLRPHPPSACTGFFLNVQEVGASEIQYLAEAANGLTLYAYDSEHDGNHSPEPFREEERSKRALSGWEEVEANKGVDELILFWFAGTHPLHLPQLLNEFLYPRGSFAPNFFPALSPGTFTRNQNCKRKIRSLLDLQS